MEHVNWKKPSKVMRILIHYENIKKIIEESIEKNKSALVFHESNSCPEFWENTRLATGSTWRFHS